MLRRSWKPANHLTFPELNCSGLVSAGEPGSSGEEEEDAVLLGGGKAKAAGSGASAAEDLFEGLDAILSGPAAAAVDSGKRVLAAADGTSKVGGASGSRFTSQLLLGATVYCAPSAAANTPEISSYHRVQSATAEAMPQL